MKKISSIGMQGEAANQRRIAFIFCLLVAVIIICFILFESIMAQAAPSEHIYKYYTSIQIESGDTLWEIADEYISDEYSDIYEYIAEVCTINHISEDEIHTGQYIVVPYYSSEVRK